jgi:hypothetical protein
MRSIHYIVYLFTVSGQFELILDNSTHFDCDIYHISVCLISIFQHLAKCNSCIEYFMHMNYEVTWLQIILYWLQIVVGPISCAIGTTLLLCGLERLPSRGQLHRQTRYGITRKFELKITDFRMDSCSNIVGFKRNCHWHEAIYLITKGTITH